MIKTDPSKSVLCHAPVACADVIDVTADQLPAAFRVRHETYTAHYTSLDFIQDEGTARAYVYARADLADAVSRSIEWEPLGGGVSRGVYRSCSFDRDVSGHQIFRSADPIWGVLCLGRTTHKLQTEAQLIAYLMARYHTTPRKG